MRPYWQGVACPLDGRGCIAGQAWLERTAIVVVRVASAQCEIYFLSSALLAAAKCQTYMAPKASEENGPLVSELGLLKPPGSPHTLHLSPLTEIFPASSRAGCWSGHQGPRPRHKRSCESTFTMTRCESTLCYSPTFLTLSHQNTAQALLHV